MPEFVIGPATPEQRLECERLVYEVYCEEMGILHQDADPERRAIRYGEFERAHILCACAADEGEAAGTVALLKGEPDGGFPMELEQEFAIARFASILPRTRMGVMMRFVVRERYRGSVLPFRLILELGREAIAQGVQIIFCDCQPHLLRLYQDLGFRQCAPAFDASGFGMMAPLLFNCADIEWLRSIRSPLLRYFPDVKGDPDLAARIRALLPAEGAAALPENGGESWSEIFALLNRPAGEEGVFAGFTEPEVAAFLGRGRILTCAQGQHVIVRGQSVRTAYVVVEGAVDVRFDGETLARMTAGDTFGEFAFLLHSKRTADVFAATAKVRLLVLDEVYLERLLTTHPALAARFFLNLSRSLALRLLRQTRQL